MRLTSKGYQWLKSLKILEYPIGIKTSITPRDLLLLERHFSCLYFVQNLKNLIVFDETTASMLHLHNGDLQTYLKNLNISSNKFG